MNSIKIMHIADYHIGYEYSFLENASEKRKIEVLKSLEKLCDFSNKDNIDIVLIAGDFIEASTITSSYIKEIKSILSKFQARIFLVAGNHDYISLGSPYLDEDWPDNMHIFKSEEIEKVYIPSLNTCIYGASFTSTYQREGFLTQEIEVDESMINIGIFHGDALYQEDYLYNPIRKEEIEKSNFDYIALGHIHKKSGILTSGKVDYAYPGSSVSITFGEEGQREAIIANIGKETKNYNFHKIEIGQFVNDSIEISDIESERELSEKIIIYLEEKYSKPFENYYNIILTGYIEENSFLDLTLLKSMLNDFSYVNIVDKTKIKLDFEVLKTENSLRGVFINNILEEQKDVQMREDADEIDILQEALDITLKAFEGN